MSEHILIAGATGLVGFAAMKHFAGKGYKVTALSRRKPFETFGATHIPLDLTDRDACAEVVSGMGDVTRLVFAALYEKPGLVAGWLEADQIIRRESGGKKSLEDFARGFSAAGMATGACPPMNRRMSSLNLPRCSPMTGKRSSKSASIVPQRKRPRMDSSSAATG